VGNTLALFAARHQDSSQRKPVGTWNLEPGTWNLKPGTWNLEPGPWNL